MIYRTGAEYRAAPQKRVLLFGMSGLGKTYLSNMLRDAGRRARAAGSTIPSITASAPAT